MADRIKNKSLLETIHLRKDALSILEAGYEAIDTRRVIQKLLEWDEKSRTLCVSGVNFCLPDYERIYCVAIGKCAVDGAKVIEEILGNNLTGGYVLDVQSGVFSRLKSRVGTHPLPTVVNMRATEEISTLINQATEKDLVIGLVSGGGSALLCSPYDNSCEELSKIIDALMRSGATIHELNTVRKHLSVVQGGHLARIAYPATVLNIVFSDVIGDDVSMIASGPFVKDLTTADDARNILEKYNISNQPGIIIRGLSETPKEDEYFKNIKTIVAVNNQKALEAMRNKAEALGFGAEIVTNSLSGEASEVGRRIVSEYKGTKKVYLFGGETTVTVDKKGKGGRNQELALGALQSIAPNQVLIASASDGWDNSEVAGAIVDSSIIEKVKDKKLDPDIFLEEHNSFHFWESVGGHIITGRTGSNVADLTILICA